MALKTALFVFATLVLTVIFAIAQQKTGLNFEKISLPQLAPAAVVLILFLIYKDLPARINLYFDKTILFKSLASLAIPVFLFTAVFFVGKLPNLNVKLTESLTSLPPLILAGMLVGAFGEEIGWRSFLQPMLEKKNSVLASSILVGAIWGLWHVGNYKNGLLFMAGFLLFTISVSVILAWLLRGTEYNLIISAMFHLSINIGFGIFFRSSMADGKFMLINGLVWLISAAGIAILTRKVLIEV